MPTPNAETGTEYIEIADFSPGIYSDYHATRRSTINANSELTGNLFGNGLARVDGTERCHADKTGALIPLPRAHAGANARDFVAPHPSQFNDETKPYRYLLDANIGPLLTDGTENESFPWTAVFNAVQRAPIFIAWTENLECYAPPFGLNHVHTREYHHWHHLTSGNLFDPATTALHNETVWLDAIVGIVDQTFSIALPIASLCNARFYYGATLPAFDPTAFTVVAATDVFTGTQEFGNDEAVTLTITAGAAGVVAATTYYVRDSSGKTFKLAATLGGAVIDITSDGSGTVRRNTDSVFRPVWQYPVTVSMFATDHVRWGRANRWRDSYATSLATILLASAAGLAITPDEPGGQSAAAGSWDFFSPAIGLKGLGTTILAMSLQNSGRLDLPFNTFVPYRWLFHYSERGTVPQNNSITDIARGPMNPYLLVAHQGRIVMADRRRTPPALAEVDADPATPQTPNRGFQDDLIWYSDYHLPLQYHSLSPLAVDRGQTNAAVISFPQATFERYNNMLVAEDVIADVGAMGPVTIDQFIVIKQRGGGALVQGDLDNPTVMRLPFIKSTGGTISHGCLSPVGFVYGTDDGVYTFQGGETSVHLSPQLDGDFWDHAPFAERIGAASTYSGARGRFAYWEDFIACPNNYLYDIQTESWWRFGMQTLAPVEELSVPYNVYVTGPAASRNTPDTLFAFPWKHRASPQGHVTIANGATGSLLSVTDPFGALSFLDVRAVIRLGLNTNAAQRTIAGQYRASDNQRAWAFGINAAGDLTLHTSTDGTAGTVVAATCDTNANFVGNPTTLAGGYQLIRATWRASDGRVQFFTKSAGDIYGRIQEGGDGSTTTSWRQIGVNKLGVTAALHNSTAPFTITDIADGGNQLDDAEVYSVWVDDAIDDDLTPIFQLYPQDFPDDPNNTATSFPSESGHTVSITRGTPILDLFYSDVSTTPPVWYLYDKTYLDSVYRWASHPLVETMMSDRTFSFQSIELIASYGGQNALSVPVQDANSFIEVTLRGFDECGNAVTPVTTVFQLTEAREPQLLRADVIPNFNANYVTVEIYAHDDDDLAFVPCWAPKLHSIKFATKPRAKRIRNS